MKFWKRGITFFISLQESVPQHHQQVALHRHQNGSKETHWGWELYEKEFNNIGKVIQLLTVQARLKRIWNQTEFDDIFIPSAIQCHDISHGVCTFYESLAIPPYGINVFDCHARDMDEETELQFGASNAEYFRGLKTSGFYAYENKICHSTNSTRKESRKKVIFSLAESYDCKKLSFYLRSLRSTGCHAEVVLIRNDPFLCPELESTCGQLSVLPYTEFAGSQPDVIKWIVALKWMRKNREKLSPCSHVMFSDFSDLLFQEDPFYRFASIGADLVMSEEFKYGPGTLESPDLQRKVVRDPDRLTIRNEVTKTNYHWLKYVAEEITGENCFAGYNCPILNSGVVFGNYHGMMRFLHVYAYLALSLDLSSAQLTSQAMINYAYYQGLYASIKVKVLPLGVSTFAHGHAFHPPTRFPSEPYDPTANPFVNYFNESYAIVHMINRFHFEEQLAAWQKRFMQEFSCRF